jgi:hypothetical protein
MPLAQGRDKGRLSAAPSDQRSRQAGFAAPVMIFGSLHVLSLPLLPCLRLRRIHPQLHHYVRHLPVAGSLSDYFASATATAYIMVDPAGSCPAAFGLPPGSTASHMAVVAEILQIQIHQA